MLVLTVVIVLDWYSDFNPSVKTTNILQARVDLNNSIRNADFLEIGQLTAVSASEVLAKIQYSKPVEYNHVVIIGDLDLNKLNLSTRHMDRSYLGNIGSYKGSPMPKDPIMLVRSPIRIINSMIDGDVNFNNTIFENPITFDGVRFNRSVTFLGSFFRGPASFQISKFCEDADFLFSNFTGAVSFEGSNFTKKAIFSDSSFNGSVDFGFSSFNGIASFDWSSFDSNTIFSSDFATDASFDMSHFNGYTSFSGSRFKGPAFFQGASFLESLDLTGISFNQFDIYWSAVNRLICNDGLTYLALIKNFRDLEQFDAANDVYYQYRMWRQNKANWLDMTKYSDIFEWLSCGYGVRPLYPILWSFGLIIFFGIIY